MRKKMEKLAERLNNEVMYFTENPLNFTDYEECKYFLVWQQTHTVYAAFRTQAEMIEELEYLIEQKIVWCHERRFKVIKD